MSDATDSLAQLLAAPLVPLRDLVAGGKATGDTSAMEDPGALDAVAAVVHGTDS